MFLMIASVFTYKFSHSLDSKKKSSTFFTRKLLLLFEELITEREIPINANIFFRVGKREFQFKSYIYFLNNTSRLQINTKSGQALIVFAVVSLVGRKPATMP